MSATCSLILDALARDPAIADRFKGRLRSTKWLDCVDGSTIGPADVLALPEGDGTRTLSELFAGLDLPFVLPIQLHPEVISHPAYRTIEANLFTRDREAVQALAMQMEVACKSRPSLRIGCLPIDPVNPAVFSHWDAALRCDGLASHGGWRLVRALDADGRLRPWMKDELAPALCGDLKTENLVCWLRDLANAANLARSDASRRREGEVFRYYLNVAHEAFPAECFRDEVLSKILLPTEAGEWRDARELTASEGPYARGARLETSAARCMKKWIETLPIPPAHGPADEVGAQGGDSADVLRAYFEGWGEVSAEAIGLFLAMLGDGEKGRIRALAQERLGNQNIDALRRDMEGLFDNAINSPRALASRAAHVQIRFRVVEAGVTLSAMNLLGEAVQLPGATSDGDIKHLIHAPEALDPRSDAVQRLTLRRLNSQAPPELRLRLLRASLVEVVRHLAGYRPRPAFDGEWDRRARSGQVHVDAVRAFILRDRLIGHLETLAVREIPALDSALRAHETAALDLHRRECADPGHPGIGTLRTMTDDRRKDVERLVEEAPDVQERLLNRLRFRLHQSGYSADRVPFELFQNADDAALQLRQMRREAGLSPELPDTARRFEVEVIQAHPGAQLEVRHWGRPINRYMLAGAFEDEGRRRGYDRDLLRMMTLNASEKDESQGTTGRFGLGFKSVYLLSNRPVVQSDLLAFEAVAGFLPRRPEQPASTAHLVRDGLPPTVIRLPVEDLDCVDAAIRRLRDWGGLLPVFSQEIRALVFTDRGKVVKASWAGEPVSGVPHAKCGTGLVALHGPRCSWLRIAVEGELGPIPALALCLVNGKVARLGQTVPTVWCTAPTAEEWGLGFCVNGPFSLDPGRGLIRASFDGLADSEPAWLHRLGDAFSLSLVQLEEGLRCRWAAVAPLVLDLPGTTAEPMALRLAFWQSLWDVLGPSLCGGAAGARGRERVVRALLRGGRGLAWAAGEADIVPTGLEGQGNGLTRASRIKGVASGALADPGVRQSLASLGWVAEAVQAGSLVSEEVAGWLAALDLLYSRLTLTDVLQLRMASDGRIEASRARDIGTLLNRSSRPVDEEKLELDRWLSTLCFRAGDGRWRPATTLMLPDVDGVVELLRRRPERHEALDGERLAAAFVPTNALLHMDYDQVDALDLFIRCRGASWPVPVEQIADWARGASDKQAQRSVVDLLVSGRGLADKVAEQIRNNGGLPWLPDLVAIRRLQPPLDNAQERELRRRLDILDQAASTQPEQPRPQGEAEAILEGIAGWWERNRVARTREWEDRVYPELWLPNQLAPALKGIQGDERQHEAWMVLFALGTCQSIGRVKDEQNRDFLRLLMQNDAWWEVIARPAGERDANWIVVLEGWTSSGFDQRKYDRWFSLFPAFYQYARWMVDYIPAFRDSHMREEIVWRHLLAPGADPVFQGADFRAPPLMPLLRNGGHWIFRELVRLGVVPSTARVHPHCYPPRRALRLFLRDLGLPDTEAEPATSRDIHRFMQSKLPDPSLARSFDIPLVLIASDSDLRTQALRQQLP
jgi:hypothetical protein